MSDLKPQSRFRLASKESHQPTFPVAGPIPNHAFLGPLEGGISIELQSEQALAFEESIALGELSRANLSTTGYDNPELIEMAEEQAAAFAPPPIAIQPKKITMSAIAPPQAKPIPGFDAVPPQDLPVSSPRLDARTLHTKFAFGPNPNKPKPAPAPAAPPPVTTGPAVTVKPPVQAAPPPPKPAPVVTKPAPPPPKIVKPAAAPPLPAAPAKPVAPSISVKPPSTPPPPPAPVQQPTAAAAAAPAPAPIVKPAAEAPKQPEKPVEKPVAAAEQKTPPPPEKPKINVRPASTTTQRPPVRSGNAVPVERPEPVAAPAPAPAPKPKVQPIRPATPSIAAEAPATATASSDIPRSLGMSAPDDGGAGKKKMGIMAAVLVVVGGGGYYLFLGGSGSSTARSATTASSSGPAATITDQTPPNMIIGGGGWATNWGSTEAINKNKNISLFRPTLNMPDYRIEFRGQVEQKALGWVFRAKDPKNYYVMKIEMIKRGLNPVFALVKYAVINGKENTHTQIMLEGDYRQDNVWRVRQDVRGNKFTTYVQDKLADYWTNDDIKTGGAGFYNEKGEFGQIKLSTFSYLPAVGK